MDRVLHGGMLECHLCGKYVVRGPMAFRSHMRMHLRNKEITTKDELEMRTNLINYEKIVAEKC